MTETIEELQRKYDRLERKYKFALQDVIRPELDARTIALAYLRKRGYCDFTGDARTLVLSAASAIEIIDTTANDLTWTCGCGHHGNAADASCTNCERDRPTAPWEQDAPDHWRLDCGRFVLACWERGNESAPWMWEVFDFDFDPDNPTKSGHATSLKEAQQAAMQFLPNAGDITIRTGIDR